MRLRALALVLLAGCGTLQGVPDAGANVGKVWTVQAFVERHGAKPVNDALGFGGFAPEDLVAAPNAPLYLSPARRQAGGFALNVFPGVSEGSLLGFIVTDVWENHPAPWVQPVYVPVTPDARRAQFDAESVFPVGAYSTFYSPWWEQQLVPVDGGIDSPTRTFLTSAKQALEAKGVTTGLMVLCPIVDVPEDVRPVGIAAALEVADGGSQVVVRHPLTGQRLEEAVFVKAWVDETPVTYLKLGPNRGRAEGQRLVEAPMYRFVFQGRPLRTAAVLGPSASNRGFVRRFDVTLPPNAGIFVPVDRPELREAVLARDAGVEAFVGTRADAGTGEFHEYALRVALDRSCFDAPAFPASCTWLDREARVLQFTSPRETTALATIAVLKEQP